MLVIPRLHIAIDSLALVVHRGTFLSCASFPEGPDIVPLWNSPQKAHHIGFFSPNSVMAPYLDPLGLSGRIPPSKPQALPR